MRRRFILLISKLYPRAWRNRYEQEFAALLEVTDSGLSTLLDVLKGALVMRLSTWSRRRTALAFGLVGFIFASIVALALPKAYRSTATFELRSQSNETTTAETWDLLTRTMTRSTITDLIRTHGLYARELPSESLENLVERVLRQIRIVRIPNPNRRSTVFSVTFAGTDPSSATAVVADLTERLIKENLQSSSSRKSTLQLIAPVAVPQKAISPALGPLMISGTLVGLILGFITLQLARRVSASV